MELTFNKDTISINGQSWKVDHEIHDARVISEKVVVLYQYYKGPKNSQFKNLEAFDLGGKKLWTAEHPTSETSDTYVEIRQENPLVLWNFACFVCRVDPESGKLLKSDFTK